MHRYRYYFVIARCFVITRSLICNCPLLKDISVNTKCLLVWCDQPVITCLVQTNFGIKCPRDFWKFWNCPCFKRAISKFSKMHACNLSQISLPNMRLLVLITWMIVTNITRLTALVCNCPLFCNSPLADQ